MSHAGAYLVSDLTQEMTAIHCPKCGREGRYKREALLTRFGPDTALDRRDIARLSLLARERLQVSR